MADGSERFRIAVVCSSNQNRSMEAHSLLLKKGYKVSSYGTGNNVKLPGRSADQPNVYSFGTPYQYMYEQLKAQDPELYKNNGILDLLERNMKIKRAPERWQDETTKKFDLVFTYEERVFEAMLEDFSNRSSVTYEPLYIVNLPTKDNQEEAVVGAMQTYQLCQMLEGSGDWQHRFEEVLDEFQKKANKQLLFSIQFY